MRRPTREFKAEACELEGRLLMASNPPPSSVQFVASTEIRGYPWPFQIVTQQAGKATVTLSRTDTAGPLQVEVTTDPRYWGGNVGAVDQTVTFAPGQSLATVTVPIIAGAPNPGAVDASLVIDAFNATAPCPAMFCLGPLDLRIVASDPTLPPKVVSDLTTGQGIVLSFNKPMDPVGASNVNNYSVSLVYPDDLPRLFGIIPKIRYDRDARAVQIRSIRPRDPDSDPHPQAPDSRHLAADLVPGETGKAFGPDSAFVERRSRSHRPARQPDQRRHDSRKGRVSRE